MKKLAKGLCFILALLVMACSPSKSQKDGNTDNGDSLKVTSNAPAKKSKKDLYSDPLELADFAIKCFQRNEQEKLIPYALPKYVDNLKAQRKSYEQMKHRKDIKEFYDNLRSVKFTRGKVTDIGSTCKQVRYECSEKRMNVRVLLDKKGDKWLIELIALA